MPISIDAILLFLCSMVKWHMLLWNSPSACYAVSPFVRAGEWGCPLWYQNIGNEKFGSWLLTAVSTLSIGLLVGGLQKHEKRKCDGLYSVFPHADFSGEILLFEVMPVAMQKIISIFLF